MAISSVGGIVNTKTPAASIPHDFACGAAAAEIFGGITSSNNHSRNAWSSHTEINWEKIVAIADGGNTTNSVCGRAPPVHR